MEKLGIPSVPLATKSFADLAKSNASKRGMPRIRACFTPHPVWGKTPEQLMAYVEGDDPVSGKPLMKESSTASPVRSPPKTPKPA
jgi:hypothetical protein